MEDLLENTYETYVEDHYEENPFLLFNEGDHYITPNVATFLRIAKSPATIWINRKWEHGVGNMYVHAHGPFEVKVTLEVERYKKKPAVTWEIDDLMKWARQNDKLTQPSTLKK